MFERALVIRPEREKTMYYLAQVAPHTLSNLFYKKNTIHAANKSAQAPSSQ